MDFSRPTNSGTTMCGNTTTSRSGSSGYSCTVCSDIRVIENPLTAFYSAYHPSLGRRQKLQSFYGVKIKAGIAQKTRSEEHTSELQSRENLVCRLLLEKKK